MEVRLLFRNSIPLTLQHNYSDPFLREGLLPASSPQSKPGFPYEDTSDPVRVTLGSFQKSKPGNLVYVYVM